MDKNVITYSLVGAVVVSLSLNLYQKIKVRQSQAVFDELIINKLGPNDDLLFDNSENPRVTTKLKKDVIKGIHNYALWANEVKRRINEHLCKDGDDAISPESIAYWKLDLDKLKGLHDNIDAVSLYIVNNDDFDPSKAHILPKLDLVVIPLVKDSNNLYKEQDLEKYENLIEPCPESCNISGPFYDAYNDKIIKQFPPCKSKDCFFPF